MIPKKAFGLLFCFVFAFVLIIFSRMVGHSLATYFFGPYGPAIPFTTHIVLFEFKQSIPAFAIKETTSRFLGLKKSCLHPKTRRPYIVSIAGGKDISIENLENGISHAFVLQFDSIEDRDYYVTSDPVHQAFKTTVGEVVENTIVVDFQDGVFTHA